MPRRSRPARRAAMLFAARSTTGCQSRVARMSLIGEIRPAGAAGGQLEPRDAGFRGDRRLDLRAHIGILVRAAVPAGPAASAASRAPSTASGTGPATSMTTAQPSATAARHTRSASAGTGRALGRHRVSASRQVKASTAGLPSWPISVGSTISLFLSPWATPSRRRGPRPPGRAAARRTARSGPPARCLSLPGTRRGLAPRADRRRRRHGGTAARQGSGDRTRPRPYATCHVVRSRPVGGVCSRVAGSRLEVAM